MVPGTDQADLTMVRRIARRVEGILEAARERERHGQSLAVDIDARLRLQDMGAIQFQLASAILEEIQGLRQEEVVGELLALGLAAVLDGAAKVVDPKSGAAAGAGLLGHGSTGSGLPDSGAAEAEAREYDLPDTEEFSYVEELGRLARRPRGRVLN